VFTKGFEEVKNKVGNKQFNKGRFKMKKVLSLLVMSLFFISLSFAGIKEAKEFYDAGNYDEAVKEYESVIPTLKGIAKARAMYYKGYCLQLQKKYDEAIEVYQEALNINEINGFWKAEVLFHQGYCYQLKGDYDKAVEIYKIVFTTKGAPSNSISSVIRHFKDISGMGDAFILQLKTQKNEACRELLLKKASTNVEVCRAIISAMPEDIDVVSYLLPFAEIYELSDQEQIKIYAKIWSAILPQVKSNEKAKELRDGIATICSDQFGASSLKDLKGLIK